MNEVICKTNVIGKRAILNFTYPSASMAESIISEMDQHVRNLILFNVHGTMLELLEYIIENKGHTVFVVLVWKTDTMAQKFIEVWKQEWNRLNQ